MESSLGLEFCHSMTPQTRSLETQRVSPAPADTIIAAGPRTDLAGLPERTQAGKGILSVGTAVWGRRIVWADRECGVAEASREWLLTSVPLSILLPAPPSFSLVDVFILVKGSVRP